VPHDFELLQVTLHEVLQSWLAEAQLVRLDPLRHCFAQLCAAPQLAEQLWHLSELVE
jgi:hypothetical protein